MRQYDQAGDPQDRKQDVVGKCLRESPVKQRADSPARPAARAVQSGMPIEFTLHSGPALILVDAQQSDQDRRGDRGQDPRQFVFVHISANPDGAASLNLPPERDPLSDPAPPEEVISHLNIIILKNREEVNFLIFIFQNQIKNNTCYHCKTNSCKGFMK